MTQKNDIKERLDVLMASRGLAESREQAKRLLLAGQVIVEGISNPKPGMTVRTDIVIELKGKERYVSRGGLKLEAALGNFDINLKERVCADIGASTGGFTDCMLQHGCQRVFSVDVGATQMHERLRTDARVTLLERTNARNLEAGMFEVRPDFAAVDVSFISVLRISGSLREVLAEDGEAVILIKPQFEAGREAVSKGKGIIKDPAVHREVLGAVIDGLSEQGWLVKGLMPSPIAGGSGNREFLCWAGCRQDGSIIERIAIDDVL